MTNPSESPHAWAGRGDRAARTQRRHRVTFLVPRMRVYADAGV